MIFMTGVCIVLFVAIVASIGAIVSFIRRRIMKPWNLLMTVLSLNVVFLSGSTLRFLLLTNPFWTW